MSIQLPPNSTGTVVDTATVGGADREIIILGDPTTAAAKVAVVNTSAASADYRLAVGSTPRRSVSTETTSNLGIGGVFTGAWHSAKDGGEVHIEAAARADVASAASGFVIQETDDTADANFTRTITSVTVNAATTTFLYAVVRGGNWRIVYTNGGTAQASFKLTVATATGVSSPVSANGTLQVDGSAVTQPVSGTVAATQSGTWTVQPGNTANTTAWKVDGSAVTQPVSGTVTTTPPSNASTNVAQVAGTTTDTNSGVKSAGTLRVVLATDQPALTNKLLVTPDSVALPANQSVNVSQINAVTPLMGNGTTGTGSQRVTVASDNSALPAWGHGATAATVPAGGTLNGGRAATANPTAVTDGQLVGSMRDKLGRTVIVPGHVRDLVTDATITLTTTTETTLLAAVAATFLDLCAITMANTSATATRVDIRDTTAGTVRFSLYVPAGQTVGMVLQIPRPQAAVNTNWTAQLGTAVTDVRIWAEAVKNI